MEKQCLTTPTGPHLCATVAESEPHTPHKQCTSYCLTCPNTTRKRQRTSNHPARPASRSPVEPPNAPSAHSAGHPAQPALLLELAAAPVAQGK
eukprot:scaffold112312_cov22-Tisochrysis_lutea.AAC.1